MATTSFRYGYRVYTLGTGRGNSWRKPESMADLGDPYVERTYRLLSNAVGQVLKHKPDLVVADGSIHTTESDAGEPVFVLADVVRTGRRIRAEVIAGTIGDHDELVGDGVETIGDRAAGRRYRIDLHFPATGELGLVVAETCKRYTPIDLFTRWAAWLDLTDILAERQKVAAALERGEITETDADAKSAALIWRKFRVIQVSDAAYLRRLISEAKKVTVDLVQAGGVTKRGRFRSVEKKLSVLDVGEGMHEKLAEEILSWLEGSNHGAVGRVMAALSLNATRLRENGLVFNNTSVQLQASQTVSVTPSTVRDLFTYPLAPLSRPDEFQWEGHTNARAADLAALEGVDVDVTG